MTTPHTGNLSALPPPKQLKLLFQSLAVLDAIVSPEWEYRYYSHDAKWGTGETMGSMRNGSGDDLFALFNDHGCFINGFAHEHWLGKPADAETYQAVPQEFASGVSEPAFSPHHVTFCYWRLHSSDKWDHAEIAVSDFEDPDGSKDLLEQLDGDPESYRRFVEEYFEMSAPLSSIIHVYNHHELTEEIVHSLNPDASLADVQTELVNIGYPSTPVAGSDSPP